MKKYLLAAMLVCSALITQKAYSQNEFITEWVTTDGNITISTSANEIMPGETAPYVYNYNIEWFNKASNTSLGSTTNLTGDFTINSLPADTIVIKISGIFPHIYIGFGTSSSKLIHVTNWGNIQWKSFVDAFRGCDNLKTVPNQGLDLSQVKHMSYMFNGATSFNSDISGWDVSNVTHMRYMFFFADIFNSDLSGWDVSNVIDMRGMFYVTDAFNSDLSGWDVSNVTNMGNLFRNTNSFNSDISSWDLSNVTDMDYMFNNARSFNNDLSKWNISNVVDMEGIFKESNISYCNMDAILNAWAPVLLTKAYNIEEIPAASTNSAAVRTSLGNRISLASAEITNPISNSVVINTPSTICIGEQTSFTATSAYTSTYEWNNTFTGSTYSFVLTQDTTISIIAFDSLNCRSYDTLHITVEECVGLDNNTIAFTVYPNPAAEYVVVQTENVDLSNASIALLDITGKVLTNAHLTENNTMIYLANYPAGVYFIKVQVGNLVNVQKIVKR